MTNDWPVCHVFLAQLNGQSYRCSAMLDDAAFDRLMDTLHWRMPYHLRAFHTSDSRWALENPVLKAAPVLPVDIDSLLSALPPQPIRLKDKRRQETLAVRCKCGDYVLTDTEDGYGRLYRVDGITSSLITRLEAVPITLQEASAYIDQYHRHNAGPKFHKFSVCLLAYQRPGIRWTARRWKSTAAVPIPGIPMCAAASMPAPSALGVSWAIAAS